ncbi:MAG: sensor histidine kinase [Kofleriaceae bacterium]
MRSRRAWIYVLSVAALLVPAGGIAYLGAVSYRDERGAIAAQDEHHLQVAGAIADRIGRRITDALDASEHAITAGGETPASPLARHWFWIDSSHAMRMPRRAPDAIELEGIDRGPGCERALEDCFRESATRQTRVARLHAAQRAEACVGDGCAASLADAKREYVVLATFDDTGPAAQLGLVRVLRRLSDPRAEDELRELDRRFGERSVEGVSMRLVAAVLRAQRAGADALLDVASSVVQRGYPMDPILKLGVLQRLRGQLPRDLSPAQAVRRGELDERMTAIRTEARAAAGLADDLPAMVETAASQWRGMPAAREPARTLIFRRIADGGVVGVAVDNPMLEEAAGHESGDEVAPGARAIVLPAGASPSPGLRRIVQVPLGEALPHLAIALVNPLGDLDPRDEVVRERSQRHVVYTSLLVVALVLGLLLMIRGAARERELARLKSDFVSTVSHELKTPLTSIRMFAEMLEQGVAKGDASKMARYHGVIVQESQRLGHLIANLLDYAQIEKGTRRYAPLRLGIEQLARRAVTTFDTLRDPEVLGRNGVVVDVSSRAMTAQVEVDQDVVVQAVLNLLANAAKYGGVDQPIEVTVDAGDADAWIAVRDHGPGIPPAEQARIFREFYRAPEAYRSGVEGTGLGLALVKRHIEALGGTVEVASEVGRGATFTIRFPRAEASAP